MSFKNFIQKDMLLEGGKAIKGSSPLGQQEAVALYKLLEKDLPGKHALIGSAGKKPADAFSGDVDIALQMKWDDCLELANKLSDQQHVMKGLGIISIGVPWKGHIVQVDLTPTVSLELAEWTFFNSKEDLAEGLKGSHRNEALFAICKHALPEGRYLLSLTQGLYKKLGEEKTLVTTEQQMICQLLLGSRERHERFIDVIKSMLSKSFPHKAKLNEITETLMKGLNSKGLKVDHPAIEMLAR